MTEMRPLETLGMGLATAGFVCNIMVIVVFLKSRALRKPINFFLITLAFTDTTLLFTANMGPFVRQLSQNEGVCIAVATIITMEFVFSVNFFTATAVLRYISILHPLTAKRILTWKKCAVIFLVMCLENVVLLWPMWNRSVPVSHNAIDYCIMDQTGLYAKIVIGTKEGISNIVIVYCYASIVVKRRQSRRTVRAASSHRIQPSFKGQDMKLLLQILCLYIIFTVSWLLLGVSVMVYGSHNAEYRVLIEMCTIAVIINSSVNLFIYLIFNSAFRKETGRLLCCFKNRDMSVSTGPSASDSNQETTQCRSAQFFNQSGLKQWILWQTWTAALKHHRKIILYFDPDWDDTTRENHAHGMAINCLTN